MPQEKLTRDQIRLPQGQGGDMLAGNQNIKLPNTGADEIGARNLCAQITNPRLVAEMNAQDQAEVIDNLVAAQSSIPMTANERKASPVSAPAPVNPASISTAPLAAPSLNQGAPTPALTLKPSLSKVFLTGRAGGADEVARQTGAFVINLRTLIETQMRETFGAVPTPAIVKEFQAWSSGVVSAQYPSTLTRTLLESLIRKNFPTFGQPDYWIKTIIDKANQAVAQVNGRVVVTGIDSVANFKSLQKAGFSHYHVMLSNQTAQNKQLTPDPLSDALDNDVIKKISFQRDGTRLHVIWNDSQPSPSGRFYSLPDFLGEFQSAAVDDSEISVGE